MSGGFSCKCLGSGKGSWPTGQGQDGVCLFPPTSCRYLLSEAEEQDLSQGTLPTQPGAEELCWQLSLLPHDSSGCV